ncbi:BapA/Bap/LapF family large adhesin [Pantoea sp. BAV 3049]|uniref:BapA/Bap/LapF family large adhesin n=1 Tax=Pantoea sp. BAV 3049 TaxID=2654188 RepID=UPI00131E3009|nr:BapA/Bap/LapF family large adhesin [Pantoea sp. BAV 3049]
MGDDGSWSFTPDQPLADGEHAITIDGTNADGNGTSNTVNIVVDTEATTPVLTDDAGNALEDGATTSDSTPTFGGEGMKPGSTVTITDGDKAIGEATVGDDGSWSFTPDQPLADGEHAITIDGTNADGNSTSDTVNIVVDTEATTPVLTDDAGNVIEDGGTTSGNTPTFGGDGMEPGSTVTISDGDKVIGEVTVGDDGSWSFTPDEPLADGEHAITIDGTNADGNGTTDTVNIVVDTEATAPVLTDDNGNAIADGTTTSDSTPTFGGDGMEPGSTVTITDGDTVIGEVTVGDDGSWSFTPDEPLENGDHTITIDGTNADGNGTSDTVNITVDTNAPVLTDDSGNAIVDGSTTSDSTPTFGGDGMEPGSTVTITDGDDVIGEVVVGDDGSWSFTPDEPLADGSHSITVDGTNAEGIDTSSTVNIVVDTSATEPVLTDDAGNPIADGDTTSDSTPTIGGGGMEPDSTVTISDGDNVLGEATVDKDGNWTFTPDEPLADGDHALVIDGTDVNGNGVNDTVNIVIDTEASTPGMTDEAGNPINDGDTTSDNTPTIGGGGMEPDSTVTISDGDKVIGEVTVDEDGNWTFTPDEPLADGSHEITAEGTDANGNHTNDTVNIVVDTRTPTVVMTDDAGNEINDGDFTNDSTPTLKGSDFKSGTKITISEGDNVLGEVTADENGNWSFTPTEALSDSEHTLTIAVSDAEGNTQSGNVSFTVDTIPPEGIDIASVVIVNDKTGEAIGAEGITADSTPTFSGEGQEAGATVIIRDGDQILGETTVDEDGNWSFTPEEKLEDGDHSFTFEVTDEVGNSSGQSDALDLTISAAKGINTGVIITDDNGNVLVDGDMTNDSTPTFSGKDLDAGSTVVISDGDTVLGTVTVGADGSWTFTPETALGEGDHKLTVTVTDPENNTGSDSLDVVVDTIAPDSLDPSDVVLSNDNGEAFAAGTPISDSTPTFSAEGQEAGDRIIVRDGDTVLGEATVAEDGSWSFTPETALSEGDHSFTYEVIDGAGNSSGQSDPVSWTVDSVAPEGVDISAVVITDETGAVVDIADTQNDSHLTFSGSDLEPGATVTIYDKGEAVGHTIVDKDGNWSYTDETGLYDGSHEITFTVSDAAGNSSEPSDVLDLNVETMELTATDNVSSGAAVGFTYPVDEQADLGTLISDGGLISFGHTINSDPIVVKDGSVIDLQVKATSSAFVDLASSSSLILQKYDSSTGQWVNVSQDDSSNLFGMFGLGATTSTLTLSGLTAGTYQLVYSTSGAHIGVSFNLEASKTVYTLADEGTVTDYTTATGNVMSDADSVYGTDSIPHSAYTSVTSVSMTNSDGTVTTVTLDSTTTKATLVGQYGTLTINADGSYEYVPNVAMDSIGKVDNFTYTITDSSTGATSSATLHVQIGTTNDALDLSWDATDPSANAITDIASSNEADASVTVTYHSTSVSGSATVNSGTETYSQSFTVNSADDLVTGSLTLTTNANFLIWNENFSTAMNITYDVQILNEDGTWSTVQEYTQVVAAGTHNSEVILNVDLSTLDLDAGTYRIAVTTTGATNTVTLNMSAEVVSTTDYDITANHVAKGNLLTDEGADGSVDKLSSVYTQLYVKAGDNTADTNVDSSYAFITESGVKIVGQYGTLVVYNNGSYTYTPNTSEIPAGSQDVFTYALKGANGEVVNATLTINLGVEVDGSNGGALNFHGTEANDVFAVYDTDFAAVDGADGSDTLAWHGSSNLVLSDVASKVSNIEAIDLLSDGKAGNVVVDAQSVEDVTDDSNTLYIKGSSGDTVTMTGTWINAGTVIVDSISYTHYTAKADDGSIVNLYVQSGVSLSTVACDDSADGADYTVTSAAEVVGTDNGDTFSVSDTSFTSIDGGDGFDTLSWNGTGTLTVSDIASKVSNIEEIDLLNDTDVDNLLISAQNVADITDENNTLYVKGSTSDTLTLSGSWTLVGSEVVNNVNYNHYTSKTADGQTVNLYVDRDIKSSSTETVAENNAADITGDVTLVNDSVQQTVTNNTASNTFTSDSFTINSSSDLQEIHLTVSSTGMNSANTASATWTLQVYNEQTFSWDTVTSGTQAISSSSTLNVDLSGQNSGLYRVVVDTTQVGFDAGWWQWKYDTFTIKVDVSIVSTTDYVVTSSSSITGSVFTTDNTSDGSILVKSIAAGIVAGAANFTVIAAAGTTIAGTYGTLTIYKDGSYTYTLNSESVIKLSGSEDSFTYVLADSTTKNLIMKVGVDVDGSQGGALILAGTIGDDSFAVYDTNFTTVDGKSGSDTLVWKGQGDLTLSDIADKVHNIEFIDLQANGVAAVLTLTANDIEKVTDADNALYVRGGSEDSLLLQGTWEMSGVTTLNNITYKLYTGSTLDGTVIKLYVQEGLTFQETSEQTTGELSSDELHDLTVVSVSQNGETVEVTDGSTSFKGAYGTLVIDGEGHYNYVADDSAAHSGNTDSFTYTLSDGSSASLTFNLGVEVDGSKGGDLTFTGTSGNDVFAVYDTDFISINGADGGDSLAWHGGGSLNLSNISSKVSNIETVDLLNDNVSENLVVSAESLLKVTDEHNTLYVRGGDGDTVTLNGSWEATGETLVNGVTYNHYTSTTNDGSTVQLYVEDDVTIG